MPTRLRVYAGNHTIAKKFTVSIINRSEQGEDFLAKSQHLGKKSSSPILYTTLR